MVVMNAAIVCASNLKRILSSSLSKKGLGNAGNNNGVLYEWVQAHEYVDMHFHHTCSVYQYDTGEGHVVKLLVVDGNDLAVPRLDVSRLGLRNILLITL